MRYSYSYGQSKLCANTFNCDHLLDIFISDNIFICIKSNSYGIYWQL